MTMDKKVWYVSGASKGLGLALIHKLLTKGYRVAATSRLLPALVEAAGGNITGDFLPLEVDVTDERSIADSLEATRTAFGRIDVVINNASYSAVTHTVIPQALPYLHHQGYGHLIDITPTAAAENPSPDIHLTTVMFGAFRTQFEKNEVPTTDALHVSIDGKQPGDPKKAAIALIQLATMPEPPARLILGSDAYSLATAATKKLAQAFMLVDY
jgi:dTDP-4-dehydrorhamnose reductase